MLSALASAMRDQVRVSKLVQQHLAPPLVMSRLVAIATVGTDDGFDGNGRDDVLVALHCGA